MLKVGDKIEMDAAAAGEQRYGHVLLPYDEKDEIQKGCFALVGYATDQGALRNNGRNGSDEGPRRIKQELARLYWNSDKGPIYDGGTIKDEGEPLEVLQAELKERICELENRGLQVLVLGGDHSLAFPHYETVAAGCDEKNLAVLNLDAHFDMRDNLEPNSGTGFHQILRRRQEKNFPFRYKVIGISEYTNSRKLFELAREEEVSYQLFDEFSLDEIRIFLQRSSDIYMNICMDVVSSSMAPGVSAYDPLGLSPREVHDAVKLAASSGKVRGFAIAEAAPIHDDEEDTTAKLAARFIAAFIQNSPDRKGE